MVTPQPCGASLPKLRDAGWECTGRGLVAISTCSGIPIVLPARALEVVEPEPWWEIPIVPFTGGDHFHLVVPRRPTTFKGDCVAIVGDAALSFRYLGTTDEGWHSWTMLA